MFTSRQFKLIGLGAALAPAFPSEGSLPDALDTPQMTWQADGDSVWQSLDQADAEAGASVAEVRLDAPAGGVFAFECQSSWIETTASGPGTVAIAVRHNHNPYTRITLQVDGAEAESWDVQSPNGPAPGASFSEWRRLTAPLPPGAHTIRLVHEFGCPGIGTLYIQQPAVQADHVRILPPLGPGVLEAIDVPADSTWIAGGAVDFQILLGPDAHDGADALRAPTVETGPTYNGPWPPWLRRETEGPVTLAWWEREHVPSPSQPWAPRTRFVPPGRHTFLWTAAATGQDLDTFTETAAPEVPLGEALESGGRSYAQEGPRWQGVHTAAAPDGDDAAWVRVTPQQESWLESMVDGPATVRFRFSTSASIETGGHLAFSINDRPVTALQDGVTAILPVGRHRIRWTASVYSGSSATLLLDGVGIEASAEVTLVEALDAADLNWSSGPVPWLGLTTSAAPDGSDAAVPPELSAGESAWVETSVTGPGRLSFRWPLADQAGYASTTTPLQLVIDGRQVLDQTVFQSSPSVEVGPGLHTFRWLATGQAAWRLAVLDQVRWQPLAAGPQQLAVDGLAGPLAVPDGSRAVPVADVTHDGIDALRLLQAGGGYSWQPSSSVTTWTEGPGYLFFWYLPSTGASLAVDNTPTRSWDRDGAWHRGILFIPPGWRRQSWSVQASIPADDELSAWLDEISFAPATAIPLDVALAGAGPWRTSPEAAWSGLAASFIETTVPSAHAPPSPSSWIETEMTGPAVVAFSAAGVRLAWLVDGVRAGGADKWLTQLARYALFVPAGRHTVRWHNTGPEPASLVSLSVHPVTGELMIEATAETALVRVPRPVGFSDSQVSLQYANASGGLSWLLDYSARVQISEPAAITFSVPLPPQGTRLWRAAYSPR